VCIIIDACTFSRVFGARDADFSAVEEWLFNGGGKMVLGGTTYTEELSRLGKYLPLIKELSLKKKVVVADKALVDAEEIRVKALEPTADFDDPHIVAIVNVSRCRLVCTLDSRSDRFLRDRRFYRGATRPSIYRSKAHEHLLSDSNIVGACAHGRPTRKKRSR
jgi:hypothetical protein